MEPSRESELRKLMDRLRDKAKRKVPESDAEDLVQEVMVVLVERLKRGQVDTLQAYAEGILRHVVYDYYQRKKERTVSLDQTAESESGSPSPEQRVLWMRHLRVINGLAQENQIDRALVDEHFVKGEPLREVATQLKVSPGVVNGRLFRFRQKITQRVGSCFAMFAAVMVGLWSRMTRALMAARAYSSVVGMLSVGSFATWMWWPQAQIPTQQPQTKATPAKTVANAPTHAAVAPPAPIDVPYLFADEHILPTQVTPTDPDSIKIIPVALPRKYNNAYIPTAQRTPYAVQPTALNADNDNGNAPSAVNDTKKSTKAAAFMGSRFGFGTVRTQASSFGRSAGNAAVAANTTTSSTARANNNGSGTTNNPQQGSNTQQQQPKSGAQPTPNNPPGTHKPNNPDPVQPKPNNPVQPNPKANPGNFKPNQPGFGQRTADIRAEGQVNNGQVGSGYLPDKIVMPTKKRSFCVVQDGRIYNCGGTVMTDITGVPDSPFTCGTNKRCTQLIGAGPSLLFSNTGNLYVLGHHLYRKSEDGGVSWKTPSTTQSVDKLLDGAEFVLHHTGTLWQKKQNKWHQARAQQTGTHEVRVHLAQGSVKFEDDTGFQLNGSWKTLQERSIKSVTPTLPNNGPQMKPAQPNVKPELTESTLQNALGSEEPIPVSMP